MATDARRFLAIFWSGLFAGALVLLLELALGPILREGSAWDPLRMIAAIALGEGVLPPAHGFDAGVFVIGATLHLALSIAYAGLIALLVDQLQTPAAAAVGALSGLGLYLMNFYLAVEIFPWFEQLRDGLAFALHIAFGTTAALVYRGLISRAERPLAPPTVITPT